MLLGYNLISAAKRLSPTVVRETLENPATLRENGCVITGVDRRHGR